MNNDLHEPKPGEPITASWASGVARAVRRSETTVPDAGGYTLPGGTVPGASGTQWTNADYPSLFDLRFRADDDETHALLYIGFSPICYFDEASVTPTSSVVTENGWMDIGVWSSPGQHTVELVLLTTQNMITHHNDAAWRIAGTWWILIDGAVPTGKVASDNYRRTLFYVGEDGPHKTCCAPIQFSSRPVDAEDKGTTGTNNRSLDTKENDPVLQLYGFDNPTTATNPWASDTPPTGITNSDWMLVLRRVKSNGDVEIQYMPLAQVAGSPDGNGQPKENELPEPVQYLIEAPCNDLVDHVTLYAWNPCTNSWVDLADGDDPVFWRTGGDESTCHGSKIGDSNLTPAIDLDNHTLLGESTESWSTQDQFSVGSELFVGTVIVLNESTGAVVFGTDEYAPKEITYLGADGRPHTETILAKR